MTNIKFGTDGVRGRAGQPPMDAQTCFRIGLAAGQVLGSNQPAFIARDTRRSGPDLQTALADGLAAAGISVRLGGVMPTAALALAVQSEQADIGVMITASHNPAADNGVKLFTANGCKITDRQQADIEQRINELEPIKTHSLGQITTDDSISKIYEAKVRSLFEGRPLAALKLVVDCANGAASGFAPNLLTEAGAEIIAIHNTPDGDNINLNCGSTHVEDLQAQVLRHQADAGIAFDGDADRLVLVDETGALVDGDQILARLATDWLAVGKLQNQTLVATVMSNIGLERYAHEIGVTMERTVVGDRHVAARMEQLGANLGGEPSGHILLPGLLPSGDGLVAALLPLLSLAKAKKPASQHLQVFAAWPQILHNIQYTGGDPLAASGVTTAIEQVTQSLGETGRVLVRASGTEPLLRIMAEAETIAQAQAAIDQITQAIEQV